MSHRPWCIVLSRKIGCHLFLNINFHDHVNFIILTSSSLGFARSLELFTNQETKPGSQAPQETNTAGYWFNETMSVWYFGVHCEASVLKPVWPYVRTAVALSLLGEKMWGLPFTLGLPSSQIVLFLLEHASLFYTAVCHKVMPQSDAIKAPFIK